MNPKNALAKAEKDKKDLYLQACLERRHSFTHVVSSVDRIPVSEALSAQKRLSALLSFNMKQKYSELCGFVRAGMSLETLISKGLLLCVPWYKKARICQQLDLLDGAVMELLATWWG